MGLRWDLKWWRESVLQRSGRSESGSRAAESPAPHGCEAMGRDSKEWGRGELTREEDTVDESRWVGRSDMMNGFYLHSFIVVTLRCTPVKWSVMVLLMHFISSSIPEIISLWPQLDNPGPCKGTLSYWSSKCMSRRKTGLYANWHTLSRIVSFLISYTGFRLIPTDVISHLDSLYYTYEYYNTCSFVHPVNLRKKWSCISLFSAVVSVSHVSTIFLFFF